MFAGEFSFADGDGWGALEFKPKEAPVKLAVKEEEKVAIPEKKQEENTPYAKEERRPYA